MDRDDWEGAFLLQEEMALIARKVDDRYGLTMALNNQAYVAWMARDVDRAESLWVECLAIAREDGLSEATAMSLTGLGDVALSRNSPEQAKQSFREALAMYEELGFPELLADTCVCLAAAAHAQGEVEHAVRLLGAAASLRQASGAAEHPPAAVLAYVNDVTAAAPKQIGEEAFAAAFADGRARPDQVVGEELARP
jgi:tetratricopeptide (TPR) repeat protein